MTRAMGRGFEVSRPWGESARYDVGVEYRGQYARVQVKSTIYRIGNAYVCNTRPDSRKNLYTVRQIDFLAAYIIPLDVWYIIPAKVATALKGNIWLSPHKKGHKYECFLECWDLLKQEPLGANTGFSVTGNYMR
jgi:hypothetical protein